MDPVDGDPPAPTKPSEKPESDGLTESIRQRLEALVPEMVRRTVTAGLGAVFSTEENLRKLAKDVQLPDVTGYLASSADATKDKVLEVIARETREFFERTSLAEELAHLLTTLSLEVKTEIRFVPNQERYAKVEPDVKSAVRLRRDSEDPGKAGRSRARKRDDDGGDETP
jgi:hypothetical protein